MAIDLKDKPNLSALIDQFNESDISPSLTRDKVLSGVKNAPKSYTKKEAQEVFGEDELTDEDIAALRAEAEARLALKRGLIDVAQFNKTVVDKAKSSEKSSRKGLKSVGKIAKSKKSKGTTKMVKDALDEVSPKTKVNGKVQEAKPNNPLKDISELSTNKVNPKNLAKFEENFLFSTQGLLNGEVLLDILKDTWDIYNNRDRSKEDQEDGSKDEEKEGLMNTILKLTGTLALFKMFKKKLQAGFKALKGKFMKLFGKMKDVFKKIFVDPIVKIFNYVKNFAEDLIKKPLKTVAELAGKAWNGAKNFLGVGKEAKNTANALKDTANMAKTPAAKKAAKALEEKAAKKVTKEAVKSGTKKGLKGVLSKIPVASALIDLGFMEAEVRSDMNENNISREQAYDNYVENKKSEEFSWWDAIDPFGFGQKVGAKIGVDKVGGWIGEKIGDFASSIAFGDETPAERMKKYGEEARKKYGQFAPVTPKLQTSIPDNIRNPDLREREKQITYIEKPTQEKNMTPIKFYDKDRNESPILGFGYLGDY